VKGALPWDPLVNTLFDFDNVPEQVRNKVNEVAQDNGRNGNGDTTIDSNNYQHWRAGNYRIFGSWAVQARRFNFAAYGTHTGKGNQRYSVTIARTEGKTATATVTTD